MLSHLNRLWPLAHYAAPRWTLALHTFVNVFVRSLGDRTTRIGLHRFNWFCQKSMLWQVNWIIKVYLFLLGMHRRFVDIHASTRFALDHWGAESLSFSEILAVRQLIIRKHYRFLCLKRRKGEFLRLCMTHIVCCHNWQICWPRPDMFSSGSLLYVCCVRVCVRVSSTRITHGNTFAPTEKMYPINIYHSKCTIGDALLMPFERSIGNDGQLNATN